MRKSNKVKHHPLRKEAEQHLEKQTTHLLQPDDIKKVVHELRVHQIELELQNEQLRQTQVMLEESRDQYFDLYECAPVGYLTLDQQGRIQAINRVAAEQLGVVRDQLYARPFFQYITPADRDAYHQWLRNCFANGVCCECEFRFENDGKTRWMHIEALIAADEEQEPVLRVTMFDVTERKQLIKSLSARNEDMERFTYTITHDLKSPLVTISTSLGMLQEDLEQGLLLEAEKHITILQETTLKMQQLLANLLDISCAGLVPPKLQQFDLGALIQDVLRQLKGRIDSAKVRISIEPMMISLYADRSRIAEVLQNLIENAIKFSHMRANPAIWITGRSTDTEAIVSIRDNGIGIEAHHQQKIFDIFERLNPDIEGTGIGLALVKRIIDAHHGKIWVESKPGKGSTFYVSLPQNIRASNVLVTA